MDLFDREATFGDDYLYFYEASSTRPAPKPM